jgi:predicted component of type VI protein secretion system
MAVILAVRNSPGDTVPPLRVERGEVVVGRGAGVHLPLPGQTVSRRHCTISGEGANWRIVDTSSGGTFVNGVRLEGPGFLRHGDVIRAGEIEIAVMLDQAAGQGGPPQPSAIPDSWGRAAPAGATQLPGAAAGQDAIAVLLQAAGLSRAQVGASDQQVAAVAGAALRAALGGLVKLAQDRRKARADLGVAGGADAPGSSEELLLRLLSGPPAEAGPAVSALAGQIDTHQRAVLGAMQQSLHHALDQFSPSAIKTNARGDAEAWKTYERAFDDKHDGFVEVFAQALSKTYADAVK